MQSIANLYRVILMKIWSKQSHFKLDKWEAAKNITEFIRRFLSNKQKVSTSTTKKSSSKKRYHHASSAAAWYYTVHLVFQLHRSWYCSNFSIKPISGDGTLICTTESCIIRRIHLWVLQVRHFPFQSSTFVRQGTFSYLLCILLLFWKASAVREAWLQLPLFLAFPFKSLFGFKPNLALSPCVCCPFSNAALKVNNGSL